MYQTFLHFLCLVYWLLSVSGRLDRGHFEKLINNRVLITLYFVCVLQFPVFLLDHERTVKLFDVYSIFSDKNSCNS